VVGEEKVSTEHRIDVEVEVTRVAKGWYLGEVGEGMGARRCGFSLSRLLRVR
jgi:hypothetical protein